MKKFLAIVVLGLIGLVGKSYGSYGFEADQIIISTDLTHPTTIYMESSSAKKTYLDNRDNCGTTARVYINSSVSISTTTGFFIPPCSDFSPDAFNDSYRGAIWGVSGSTNPLTIRRMRVK
jgi:hypothetical protein